MVAGRVVEIRAGVVVGGGGQTGGVWRLECVCAPFPLTYEEPLYFKKIKIIIKT